MSRNFNENVKKEIHRRESIREDRRIKLIHREHEETKRLFEENPEKFIMDYFQMELKCCYGVLRNFEQFCIYISDMCYYDPESNFRKYFVESRKLTAKVFEAAEKIGFEVEEKRGDCKFTVPAFEKGNRRTPAQLMLYKYERALAKKCRERKKQLIAECKRVKKAISDGKFRDTDSTESCRAIYVKSKEDVQQWGYEEKIVRDFFDKLKLDFQYGDTEEWMFEIN